MYKKTRSLILSVLLLTLLSCSTLSPFMKGKNYSTLALVFDRKVSTVMILSFKDEKVKNIALSLAPEMGEFLNRSDFLTVAFLEDGTVLGAFEGYYPIDSVRLITGKNTTTWGEYSIYSPDGGIVAFTNADVDTSKQMLFENRIEKETISDIIHYYDYPVSIYGKGNDVFQSYLSSFLSLDETYMDFNKIDISFSFDENTTSSNKASVLLNGSIDFKSENDAKRFQSGMKTSLVATLRREAIPFDIKTLDEKLSLSSSTLVFRDFPYYFSYNL